MTREEIRIQTIAQLERIGGMLGSMGEEKDWTEYAIRALEQEPVIDKIQEEIKRVDTVCHASNNHDELIRRNVVLQIIDKYKAESADT